MSDTAVPPSRDPRSSARGAFPHAWTVFRVRGVPVRVDVSWLLIAGFVLWLFFGRFARLLGELGPAAVVGASAAAALLFFASLLAHELGHALTSLDRGVPVLGITLFLMGGVTESTQEAKSARDEFVIVGIGPFISLVLAAVFGLAFTAVRDVAPLAAVAGYLAWTNLALAAFNVIPGYPLDGGRLLRSVLWALTKRPNKATRWAARVGQGFALLVIGLGLWFLARPASGGLDGLWEVLIGFFLYRGAADSHRRARLREQLAGRRVRDAMGSVPDALDPEQSLAEVVDRVQTRPSLPWPVGRPVSRVLRLDDINAVSRDRWATTTVSAVAGDAQQLLIEADTGMDVALDRMAQAPDGTLVVVEAGRAVGLLTPSLVSHLAP